ncbi:hypothetical protein ABI309_17830 [Citrobacter youngae]|uniref:hypothetical protein n=1 Tax=Citrobacter youngae TaxID=133448 RepID=UPI000E2E75CE|nr:hypothetical protein [Citrobacter youngae]MCO4165263.1 hypothetical protein [Citrobacter youngae]
MIYLLKTAEKEEKKLVDRIESTKPSASFNKVESLVDRKKSLEMNKALKKVLSASSKINW